MGMTAAEKSFRIRSASAAGAKDWPRVARTYEQYGTYLELIGGDVPVEQHKTYIFPNIGEESVESIGNLHHGPKKKES